MNEGIFTSSASKQKKIFSNVTKAKKQIFKNASDTLPSVKEEKNMPSFQQLRSSLAEKTLTPAEKTKREEIAKAMEREHPGMPMGKKMAIATAQAKKVAEEIVTNLDEAVKTTHEDPLVTVHDKDGLHTHANLSTVNSIFNTKVKHTDVHKGPVTVTSGRDDKHKLKVAISKHHAQAVKDEEKFSKTYGESMNITEGAEAQKRFEEYHNDAAKMLKGIHKKLSEHYTMNKKNAHWGHVGDIRHYHDQLREIHDRLHEQGEYAKAANQRITENVEEDVHYCAKHVYSKMFGEGVVVEGLHADPDEQGNIEWYAVQFNDGIKKVFTENLDIMIAEYHGNHKKKKRMTNG